MIKSNEDQFQIAISANANKSDECEWREFVKGIPQSMNKER